MPRVLHNGPRMKLLKKALWPAAAIVAVWLAGCTVAAIRSADWALHPERRALMPADEAQATAMADAEHTTLQQVAITANDGAVLRGWYIRPAPGNGDAVILLHGQADSRIGMLGPAALLLRHGYSVLMPDARAQGMSGGDLATYGIKEADDLRRWFDWLVQIEAPRCIDGLGNSMGAAQLLQSLNNGAWILRSRRRVALFELPRSILRPHRRMAGRRSANRAADRTHCAAPRG